MTTVFNRIHRLKNQPGWTWARFLTEIDRLPFGALDEKTLYNLYRQPHRKPNNHVTQIINQLHEQYFPDPFPEEINRLMALYNRLVQNKDVLTVAKDVADLAFYLLDQLSREAESQYLRRARFHWLLGHIYFDQIPYARDNGKAPLLKQHKQQAITHYSASVGCIEQYNQQTEHEKVGPHHLYKARHNILACYLNAVPLAQRQNDPELLAWLRQSDYIANSKLTLQAEPFQWSIARNGLRFASLLQNADDVRYFFAALVAVSDYFRDLSYQPLNFNSIADSSDFAWAVANVLNVEKPNE